MADPVETPRRNLTRAVAPAVAAAVLAALGALFLVSRNGIEQNAQTDPALRDCILEQTDAIGGPIDLVDPNGARVTQADFAGQPAVVYFGFTHCPDVCPTTMYTLAQALAQPNGYDVQPVLITVDPARDTPAVMGAYVHTDGYPSGLVGLSGSEAQIEAAKRAFRVYAARAPIASAAPDVYNVDHSSFLYVMDGQWRPRAVVPTMRRSDPNNPTSPMIATPPETIAACIAAGLERS